MQAAKKPGLSADALFVLIGAHPHSDWLPAEIARDAHGFLLTGTDIANNFAWPPEKPPLSLETSLPGVLAAGDIEHGLSQTRRFRRGRRRNCHSTRPHPLRRRTPSIGLAAERFGFNRDCLAGGSMRSFSAGIQRLPGRPAQIQRFQR